MTDERGRGCLKWGCFGCLGVVVLVVLVTGILLLLGLATGGREVRVEPVDLGYEVPRTDPPGFPAPPPGQTPDRPTSPRPEWQLGPVEVDEPGRISLDFEMGNLSIVPGPAGSPVRLEGEYDAGGFELEESYETYGEAGWSYKVKLNRRGIGFRIVNEKTWRNRLRLVVPRDVPILLEGSIGTGESRLELGGLWLIDVDLDTGVGEHSINFGEPLPAPMERFAVDGSIGVLAVSKLGNASPAKVHVSHNIGECRIDLHGSWSRDADVRVRCGIGECAVRVPPEVGVAVQRAGVLIGEARRLRNRPPKEEGGPTLTINVASKLGEVRVD